MLPITSVGVEFTPRESTNPLFKHSYAAVFLAGKLDAVWRSYLWGKDWLSYYSDLYAKGQPGWLKALGLLGIELPLNYGPQYRTGLRAIYADLAREDHAALVPFLLDGVALAPRLMQPDGLHPTAAAQPRVLANVWSALAPLLATGK